MNNAKKYSEEELINLRAVQKEMLLEVKRICDELHISYVAVAGTALGAVRHQGFIPWDDDLDIAMRRDDYDRFMKLAPSILNEKYFLQNIDSDPEYINYFAKIRCNNTLFVQKNEVGIEMHHGIFIDIFPLDYITEDVNERKKYKRKLMIDFQLFMAKSTSGTMGENDSLKGKIKHLIRLVTHYLLSCVSKIDLYTRVDKLCKKYNGKSGKLMTIAVVYAMNIGCVVDEDIIFPTKECSFEDIKISIPNNADKYLTIKYGDYMKLPPEDKRTNHRPVQLKF